MLHDQQIDLSECIAFIGIYIAYVIFAVVGESKDCCQAGTPGPPHDDSKAVLKCVAPDVPVGTTYNWRADPACVKTSTAGTPGPPHDDSEAVLKCEAPNVPVGTTYNWRANPTCVKTSIKASSRPSLSSATSRPSLSQQSQISLYSSRVSERHIHLWRPVAAPKVEESLSKTLLGIASETTDETTPLTHRKTDSDRTSRLLCSRRAGGFSFRQPRSPTGSNLSSAEARDHEYTIVANVSVPTSRTSSVCSPRKWRFCYSRSVIFTL